MLTFLRGKKSITNSSSRAGEQPCHMSRGGRTEEATADSRWDVCGRTDVLLRSTLYPGQNWTAQLLQLLVSLTACLNHQASASSLTPPLPAKRKRHPRCPPWRLPPQQDPLLQPQPLRGTPTKLPVPLAPYQPSCLLTECLERVSFPLASRQFSSCFLLRLWYLDWEASYAMHPCGGWRIA